MKKALIILTIAAALFAANTKTANACFDPTIRPVGKAKVKVRRSGSRLYICYTAKWSKKGTQGLKFQGFRIPSLFKVWGAKVHDFQVLKVSGATIIDADHAVVVHFKRSNQACFTVSPKRKTVSIEVPNKKGVYVMQRWSRVKQAKWLQAKLVGTKTITRKASKKGATLGWSRQPHQKSRAKGMSCGSKDPRWVAKRPNANTSNF